jgi:hypothetical protein
MNFNKYVFYKKLYQSVTSIFYEREHVVYTILLLD